MALRYNGIEFPYPLTQVSVAGPGRDPSGSDQLYTEIRIRAKSLLNVQLLPGEAQDENAGGVLARIRHMLTAPRKELYYDLTSLPGQSNPNVAIINVPGGRPDDANGPWPDPDAFSASYVTPSTIEVSWGCTVRLRDCDDSTTVTEPLSLRWEDSLSWDDTFKCTYRRAGTLIISSRSTKTIDHFRRKNLAPAVAAGFRRRASNYLISRDGLRCDFMFLDEQIRFAPPAPAVDMELVQSESFPTYQGMRHGEVFCSLTGAQNADVKRLAAWAMRIGMGRLWAANPLSTRTGRIISDAVVKTRERPSGVEVAFMARYRIPPTPGREQMAAEPTTWDNFKSYLFGGTLGVIRNNGDGQAPPSAQGKDLTTLQTFDWIGLGTSKPTPQNPTAEFKWGIRPDVAVVAPADGLDLATSVGLFAAALHDPCGEKVDVTPDAEPEEVSLKSQVSYFNSELTGNTAEEDESQVSEPQLTAAISQFTLEQYPAAYGIRADDSLFTYDGAPAAYDHWQCLSEYATDPNRLVLPTGDPDGNNIRVDVGSTVPRLTRRWSAARTGVPPRLPPKVVNLPDGTVDDNWVLTNEYEAPRENRVGPDGVSIRYEVSGIYEFAALRPADVKKTTLIPPYISAATTLTETGWLGAALDLAALGVGAIGQTLNGVLNPGQLLSQPPT